MGDVTIKESRYRILYTPEGGEVRLLPDAGDEVDTEHFIHRQGACAVGG